MLRKLTAGVLAYRAILLIVHGLGWLWFDSSRASDLSGFSMVSMGIAMLSMSAAMVLLTFAYLATRRTKAEWSSKNAVLDGNVESADTDIGQGTSHSFDSDAVIERYLAEKSVQQSLQPSPLVKPIAAVSSRPVFGRKAI